MVDIFDTDYYERRNQKNGPLDDLCGNNAYADLPFATELRTITYFEDDQRSLYCKISGDFSKVILVNR